MICLIVKVVKHTHQDVEAPLQHVTTSFASASELEFELKAKRDGNFMAQLSSVIGVLPRLRLKTIIICIEDETAYLGYVHM